MAIEINPRTPTRFFDDVTSTAEALGVDVTAALAPITAEIQRRAAIREARANSLDAKTVREQILAADPADVPALIERLASERAHAAALQDILTGPGNLAHALDHQIAAASMDAHADVLAAFAPVFDKAARTVTKSVEASPAGVDLLDPASVLAAGVEKQHRDLTASLSVLGRISDLARHGARRFPAFVAAVEVPAGTQVERLTNNGRVPAGETPLSDEVRALNESVSGVSKAGTFGRQIVAAVRAGFGLALACDEATLQDRLESVERAETVLYVDRLGPSSRRLR